MLTYIKNLFKSKPKVQKYSSTLTSATVGVTSKKELSPEVTSILNKLDKNEQINNNELNSLISFYFNVPTISPGLFTLNKEICEGMVLDLNRIDTERTTEGDVSSIHLNLTDIVFGNDISIKVNVNDFHEFFKRLQLSPAIKEK